MCFAHQVRALEQEAARVEEQQRAARTAAADAATRVHELTAHVATLELQVCARESLSCGDMCVRDNLCDVVCCDGGGSFGANVCRVCGCMYVTYA